MGLLEWFWAVSRLVTRVSCHLVVHARFWTALLLQCLCAAGVLHSFLVACCSPCYNSVLICQLRLVALPGFSPALGLEGRPPTLEHVAQASVREVKRLDSISRSPVYTSIGEALNGLPTIRAYHAEQRLTAHNAYLVDNSAVMSLVNQSMNRCGLGEHDQCGVGH